MTEIPLLELLGHKPGWALAIPKGWSSQLHIPKTPTNEINKGWEDGVDMKHSPCKYKDLSLIP